jgi:hypothetical protein
MSYKKRQQRLSFWMKSESPKPTRKWNNWPKSLSMKHSLNHRKQQR